MGLDLTLIPVDHESDGWGFGHTLLDLERRRDLFEEIQATEHYEGGAVPKYFATHISRDDKYEGPHYGDTQETPYGKPLLRVSARSLLFHKHHEGVRDNARNRAVWAYLSELSPGTKIALYWS